MELLTGIAVSPGVAIGRAVVLTGDTPVIRFTLHPHRIDDELALLDRARDRSRAQLRELRDRLADGLGHELAPLFDAQLLMLDDTMFLDRARAIIREERVNAAWAVHRSYEALRAVFAEVADPYLRERGSDLADVAGRVRMNLRDAGTRAEDITHDIDGPVVLVADELTASLAAQLDWAHVRGFATDAGGRTHHTAILARSLKVPAVVGLRDASRRVHPGTPVIVDGSAGTLMLDPSPSILAELQQARLSRPRAAARATAAPPQSTTADGVPIRLEANLERLSDIPAAIEAGAEGIGLFRSEFLLVGRDPEQLSEDQQARLYAELASAMAPRRVTIRTFDLDERHALTGSYRDRRDAKPGLRGVRLGLAKPHVLETQLRALMRAAPAGHLRVMFPFVTSVEEMRAATALAHTAARHVGHQGPAVPVGAMVEVPSAALTADLLANESAFLTVGTNDLIQYTLAVDRTDERVSDLYRPLHPAVLRLLRLVRRAAARRRVDLSVCGEMASEPAVVSLLVGLGFRAFSMTPSAIPAVRRIVQALTIADVRRHAAAALGLPTADEVQRYLLQTLAIPARGAGAS